jgi:prepilin peptidase CpaA
LAAAHLVVNPESETAVQFLTENFSPQQIAFSVIGLLCAILAIAMWFDAKSNRIPNKLVFAGAGLGLLLNSMLPQGFGFTSQLPGAVGLLHAAAGLALGLAILLPFYMLRTLGAGDVKLMAMVGAFVGPNAILSIVLLTFIIGGFLAIAIAFKQGVFQAMLANLKHMAMGSYFKLALHEMPTVDAMPHTAAKMPYAIAIAAGTFAYIYLAQKGHMPLFKIM